MSGNDNIEKAWNFYKKQGFSDEATAGILGNFMHESGMQPDVKEIGNNIGYGLAQWSFERRTNLENWAKENNLDVKTLTAQLNFSMYEMNSMNWVESYKKIKDIYQATDIFHNEYEKAGIINMASRYQKAEAIYKKYKG